MSGRSSKHVITCASPQQCTSKNLRRCSAPGRASRCAALVGAAIGSRTVACTRCPAASSRWMMLAAM